MNDSLNNFETIRQYLLGRISDENTLESIEESMFLDEEFCNKVELAEDELINDYCIGKLNEADLSDFERTLLNNSDRRSKVKITQALKEKLIEQEKTDKVSIFDSLKAFFRQPIYAGGLVLVLMAIIIGAIVFSRSANDSELAELKNIYKENRPFESRITEFEYAPYKVTRGGENLSEAEKRKLKIIENELLKKVESNSKGNTHNDLGVFYISQAKYPEAIKELETAVKLEPENARFRNNLGSAYFEFAKNGEKDKRFLNVNRANEEFSKALQLQPNLLEALFNRSLTLQENQLFSEAKKSWELYLQKDPASKWAEEARKNLERIKLLEVSLNKNETEILNDFLIAYRINDENTFIKIQNSTKGIINNSALFQQLTNRFLDARLKGDSEISKESIDALKKIAEKERIEYGDFFLSDLAEYYSKIQESDLAKLKDAKNKLSQAFILISQAQPAPARIKFDESEADLKKLGNFIEAGIASQLSAQLIIYDGKLKESSDKMKAQLAAAQKKNYKMLSVDILYYLGMSRFRQGEFSEAIKYLNSCLKLSEETNNFFKNRYSSNLLADTFSELGETSKSLEILNYMFDQSEIAYFPAAFNRSNLRLTVQILLKTNLIQTAIDFGNEAVHLSKDSNREGEINESLYYLTTALTANKDYENALKSADQSLETAQSLKPSNLTPKLIADAYQTRADIYGKTNRCQEALRDFEKLQKFYNQRNEVSYNTYELEKGKLLCFKKLGQENDFQNSLERLLTISEEVRRKVKEDQLRQSFFDNEQIVLDLAIDNALDQNDKEQAFEISETLKSRSLLDFINSTKSIVEVEQEFGQISKPFNLSEIQKRMPENVQIVEYSLLPSKLIIWLISKNSFEQFERQIDNQRLNEEIESYLELLKDQDQSEKLNFASKKLYQLFIPEKLEKDKIICIIPDKSLHQIPFSSLRSAQDKYLIEDFTILNSPSSSVFLSLTEKSHGKPRLESLLSIGNPAFDHQENEGLADLPDAEIEAKEIAINYPISKKYISREATKKNFLDEIKNSEIIHFAGHFVVNQTLLSKSKMVFADEALYSFELFNLKLPKAKFVVLSACQTGLEKLNNSEGSTGIARTFLGMGAPFVVASYWKVDSEATKDLMISFHRNRTLGSLTSVESLRKAQLEMLKTEKFAHPNYWSAFSLSGGFTEY